MGDTRDISDLTNGGTPFFNTQLALTELQPSGRRRAGMSVSALGSIYKEHDIGAPLPLGPLPNAMWDADEFKSTLTKYRVNVELLWHDGNQDSVIIPTQITLAIVNYCLKPFKTAWDVDRGRDPTLNLLFTR
jgi:hypothetical protein